MLRTLAVTIVAMLSLSLAGPASARAEVMTQEQAGRTYLAAACVRNDAGSTFSRRVWHGRTWINTAEVQRRLPELRRLSITYSRALSRAGRIAFNPPGEWPDEVRSLVGRVADAYVGEGYWRSRQGRASSAGAWLRFNGQANRSSNTGVAPTKIRALLELPPPGEGC